MKVLLKIILAFTALLIVTAPLSLAEQAAEEDAVKSSMKWLALVDEGKYGESWTETAQLFRSALSREQWQKSLESARKPLGKTVSRKLKSKTRTKSLPGAPDGDYVVIQYDTSFENKKSAIETVTPMLDKDGKWRVSGYYIR